MSSKEDVLSGHLRERLAQLLRDIVGVVEDAVSQFREETLRTRLENQSLRRQLGDFLRAPDKPQARPRPPDQQLFALDRQPVCVPDGVEAPPASATERAAPPGPDDGLSEALLALPVPRLKEEPQAPPPRVIKREREESKVTPGKNCAADVRISKGGADVCATAPRETERNGHFGGGAAAAGAIVYECPRCDEIFAQAARLRLHLEQKPKSYACNWCCKSFAQSADLRRHVRTHTGERPHRCAFCAKSFSQRGNLRRHVRIHTGERPYTCAVCRRTFGDGNTLKKHACTHARHKAP